jgi:hypothetical protein
MTQGRSQQRVIGDMFHYGRLRVWSPLTLRVAVAASQVLFVPERPVGLGKSPVGAEPGRRACVALAKAGVCDASALLVSSSVSGIFGPPGSGLVGRSRSNSWIHARVLRGQDCSPVRWEC